MKTFITIFFCGFMLLLFNFAPVIMFFGRSVGILYWGCIFAVMGLSFKKIVSGKL